MDQNYSQRSTQHTQLFRCVKSFLNRYKVLDEKKIVAVSGGLDSIVLCFFLLEISKQEKLDLPLPVYISHQQRAVAEEQKDVKAIKDLLKPYKQNLEILKIGEAQKKMSEDQLRTLRRKALLDYSKENNCKAIFTGHHQDDQVENFFIRLFSGAHFSGFAGMSDFTDKKFYKPFLNIPKEVLSEVAKDNNLIFNIDASNADTDFTRNHIRNTLIPMLSAQYGDAYKNNILRLVKDSKDMLRLLGKGLEQMKKESQLDSGVFLRKPLLSYSSLQLKFFFSYFFDPERNRLNSDQLDTMLSLFYKGEGQYSLPNNKRYCVSEKKVSIEQDT